MKRLLLSITILGFAFGANAQGLSGPPPMSPAPPSNTEIYEVQLAYYGLLIKRLQYDLEEARDKLAAREKAWAEYSKPLWQQGTPQ